MSSVTVKSVLKDIKGGSETSVASKKNEVAVMQAMLNDPTYKVGLYDNSGQKTGTYSPYESSRVVVQSVLTNGAKMSSAEAEKIATNYQFGKKESQEMVDLSKQFTMTYLETGRYLPLGGRETMNVKLKLKEVPEKEYRNPRDNGQKIVVPAHSSIKVKRHLPRTSK